jgi:hypothetical protein
MRPERKWPRRISGDRAVAMLEYALLTACMAVLLTGLGPGSKLYELLHGDLAFRLWIISLPIF